MSNVSIFANEGEIFGLIGPYGAGMTTFQNAVAGTYPPTSGKVIFRGRNITSLKPHQICKSGINRAYQIVRSFPRLTALENVMAGSIFGSGLSDKTLTSQEVTIVIVEQNVDATLSVASRAYVM